jgi:hypothetical protein
MNIIISKNRGGRAGRIVLSCSSKKERNHCGLLSFLAQQDNEGNN